MRQMKESGSSGGGAEPPGTAVKGWELLSAGTDGASLLHLTHSNLFRMKDLSPSSSALLNSFHRKDSLDHTAYWEQSLAYMVSYGMPRHWLEQEGPKPEHEVLTIK